MASHEGSLGVYMLKKKLALVATVASVGAVGAAFLGATPAAANTTPHHFRGEVGSFGAETFHLNCANGPGYVKGKGPNKTSPDFIGTGPNLNIFPLAIADNTKEFAFLSRVVTSMTFRAQNVGPGRQKFSYEFYCESNKEDAWRVLG